MGTAVKGKQIQKNIEQLNTPLESWSARTITETFFIPHMTLRKNILKCRDKFVQANVRGLYF